MPNSAASVAWMTSFWTSPYSDTETSRPVSSTRTLISGSCSASHASAPRMAPSSRGRTGATMVSIVGGAKWCAAVADGRPIVSPIRTSPSPASRPISPATEPGPPDPGAGVRHADAGRLRLGLAVGGLHAQPFPDGDGAAEHAHVGDLLPRRPLLDLEDAPLGRRRRVPRPGGQQLDQPGPQRLDALPGDRRPAEDGVHEAPPGLLGERVAQPPPGQRVVDVRGQHRVIPLGEHLGQRCAKTGSSDGYPCQRAARCRPPRRSPWRRPREPAASGRRPAPARRPPHPGRSC